MEEPWGQVKQQLVDKFDNRKNEKPAEKYTQITFAASRLKC